MKKITALFLIFTAWANAQIVTIPDTAFKNALLIATPSVDTNGNGQIDVSEAQAVTSLNIALSSPANNLVGIQSFSNLQSLTVNGPSITNADLGGMTSLVSVNLSDTILSSLTLSGLANLQDLNLFDCNLPALNLSGLTSLQTLDCGDCYLTSLDASMCTSLRTLSCWENTDLASLNITGLSNLKTLDCGTCSLTVLDLAGLTGLETLTCPNNFNLSSINISAAPQLKSLNVGSCMLTSIDASMLTNLTYLKCSYQSVPLVSLNVSGLSQLESLFCDSNYLSALDLSGLQNLETLNISANYDLTTLDLSDSPNISDLLCFQTGLTSLNISNSTNLTHFSVSDTHLTTLDLSHIQNDLTLYLNANPNLTYVNFKNGHGLVNVYNFTGCPSLSNICADDSDLTGIYNALNAAGLANQVNLNSYCSFVPGGNYNTIQANVAFCGTPGSVPNLRAQIDGPASSGYTFSDSTGNFAFYTYDGNYTVTPLLQNPYFAFTPPNASVNFSDADNHVENLAFCVTPLGIFNDLEITIIPIDAPRPGFDCHYRIIAKNKGTQPLAANVNFNYNDDILDYVSSDIATSSTANNLLNWNFGSLNPLEERVVNLTLNLHSPVEIPPVNIGDVLNFTASFNAEAADETPLDNTFMLPQTVSGSFDPNDKTCLEGNTVSSNAIGQYLHYLIRFQNSGTAAAENIVVRDMIDGAQFDINSLELTASSHPVQTRITGNKAEFIFENINLPAEGANEAASHGFVAFKVKTKNTLAVGNTVSNTADIFFDYNFPIGTNTANTTFALLAAADFSKDDSISISPNPARSMVTVKASEALLSLRLFDVQGRLLEALSPKQNVFSIDISSHQSGIYFIKAVTANGSNIIKIVKQ